MVWTSQTGLKIGKEAGQHKINVQWTDMGANKDQFKNISISLWGTEIIGTLRLMNRFKHTLSELGIN